jgi:histidinol-phosphate/aromatic aminotransferase/cobyric acid decarboxylase-like protein
MAQTTRPLARRGLLGISPCPLSESSVPGIGHVIELAANECAAEPSPRAVAAYQAATGRLRRYPDRSATALCEGIARAYRSEADRIACRNGSEEPIALPAKSVLRRARPPTNLSVAAQAAAIAALADQDHVAHVVSENTTNRLLLAEGLVQPGIAPQPSEGNFLLVRFPAEPSRDAGAAYRFLRAGDILVRPMHPYGLEQFLRFTIGTSEEIHAVLNALASFLG